MYLSIVKPYVSGFTTAYLIVRSVNFVTLF